MGITSESVFYEFYLSMKSITKCWSLATGTAVSFLPCIQTILGTSTMKDMITTGHHQAFLRVPGFLAYSANFVYHSWFSTKGFAKYRVFVTNMAVGFLSFIYTLLGTSTMKCMETFGDHQFVFSVETALAYWTFFFVRWRHIWIWKMKDIPSRTSFSMCMKNMSIWIKNVMRYGHILRKLWRLIINSSAWISCFVGWHFYTSAWSFFKCLSSAWF